MIAAERILSRRTTVGYAVGSLGTGGFSTLPGLVPVYYLTDTLGVAALLAGILVTVAKIWDVIIDPVIGARSDRSLAVTRSRRRFMVLGGSLIPVFFILTFAVPAGLDPVVSGLWVFVAFLLTATAFSLFQVPYIALPAELVSGYDQRTRLITWRVVVLTVAILLFGAGGPALRSLGGGGHFGYLLVAIVAGLVIGAGMLASSTIAPRNVMVPADAPRISIAQNYAAGIRALKRSRPFRALMLTFLLQGLATCRCSTGRRPASWTTSHWSQPLALSATPRPSGSSGRSSLANRPAVTTEAQRRRLPAWDACAGSGNRCLRGQMGSVALAAPTAEVQHRLVQHDLA